MKRISDEKTLNQFEEIRSQMEVSSGGRRVSNQDVLDMICRAVKRPSSTMHATQATSLLRSVAPLANQAELSTIRSILPSFAMTAPKPVSNYIHYGR